MAGQLITVFILSLIKSNLRFEMRDNKVVIAFFEIS